VNPAALFHRVSGIPRRVLCSGELFTGPRAPNSKVGRYEARKNEPLFCVRFSSPGRPETLTKPCENGNPAALFGSAPPSGSAWLLWLPRAFDSSVIPKRALALACWLGKALPFCVRFSSPGRPETLTKPCENGNPAALFHRVSCLVPGAWSVAGTRGPGNGSPR